MVLRQTWLAPDDARAPAENDDRDDGLCRVLEARSACEHQPLRCASLGRQGCEDACEYTEPAPTDEAVVQRLVRAIAGGCILPLQAISDDVDDPADHPAIVNPRQAARARKERLDPAHLSAGQQTNIGHRTPPPA